MPFSHLGLFSFSQLFAESLSVTRTLLGETIQLSFHPTLKTYIFRILTHQIAEFDRLINTFMVEEKSHLNVKFRLDVCLHWGPKIRECVCERTEWDEGNWTGPIFLLPISPVYLGSFVFHRLQGVASIYSMYNTVILCWCQWMWYQ